MYQKHCSVEKLCPHWRWCALHYWLMASGSYHGYQAWSRGWLDGSRDGRGGDRLGKGARREWEGWVRNVVMGASWVKQPRITRNFRDSLGAIRVSLVRERKKGVVMLSATDGFTKTLKFRGFFLCEDAWFPLSRSDSWSPGPILCCRMLHMGSTCG